MSSNGYKDNSRTIALKIAAIVLVAIFVVSALLFVVDIFDNNRSKYQGEDQSLDKTLSYNGKKYTLKDNIETFLVLGLDKYKDEETDSYNNNKQADFLMLFVIDNEAETCKVVHLNRDAMVEMNVLGVAGNKVATTTQQLALSHTYGNGREVSCRNTANAVSDMLMGAYIDHYVSVTMDAVAVYNDFVGGVTVEILDDFSSIDPSLVKGETMTLVGEQALTYVRSRYGLDDPTNNTRMGRQKQYLNALYDKTQQLKAESDTFIAEAALKIADYIVSDCSGNKLETLLDKITKYELGEVLDISGETVKGEEFMEFYPDEDSITEIVVECFYEAK